MRTTAIMNLKGGVGKTTTVINMAAILASEYKARVLVIDADSQCNLSEFLQRDLMHPCSLADLLRGQRVEIGLDGIEKSKYSGVDIIPADETLMDLDLSKIESGNANAYVLQSLIKRLRQDPEAAMYDYVLIDCPPAFNAASAAALIAAGDVIVPIKLDAFSLSGMRNVTRQIVNMQRINNGLKIAGYLPTMWYRSQHMEAAEDALRRSGIRVFPHIRRSDRVDESTFVQEALRISSPNSGAGIDYRAFVRAYVGG